MQFGHTQICPQKRGVTLHELLIAAIATCRLGTEVRIEVATYNRLVDMEMGSVWHGVGRFAHAQAVRTIQQITLNIIFIY